jgi:DNA helicase-4
LKELNLSNNQIQTIEELDGLTNLEHLDLRDNQITEIKGLNSLKNLRILFLENNTITELKGLDELVNLRKISLDNNNISEIKGLENLENLVYIRMNNNPIPEELQKRFCLEEGIYDGQSVVKYCRKKEQEKLIESEKAKREPEIEDKVVKMKEFRSQFKMLNEEWKQFIEKDTYLTHEKKSEFLRKLREISQFPWYYPIRYLLSYKKVKKKKKEFKKKVKVFNNAFVKRRLIEYREFFEGEKYGIEYPLDPDQREAIVRDDKHNLVIAGAGSGKTSMITSRIAYLIKRKDKIDKERILALAFTRVAAKEMKSRLASTYNIDVDISTFHALGRQIIKKELNLIPDLILKEKEITKQLFDTLIENEDFQNLFLDYLLYHSEEEIEEESFEDKELYYEYMRNLKYTTLNNIKVKSISERNIGNFLFRHDIKFEYEPIVEWIEEFEDLEHDDEKINHIHNDLGEKEILDYEYSKDEADEDEDYLEDKKYHPDFYLPEYDIFIEHWGLNQEMEIPKWFTISSEEYREIREWKLDQFNIHQKLLIET